MPLEVLAILVPLGVLLVVIVVRMSGLSKSASITDDKHALSLFRQDFAGEALTNIVLKTSDANAAFIEAKASNRLGFVEAMGDKFITRWLTATDLIGYEIDGENAVVINFRDFTHPHGRYVFASHKDLQLILEWLNRL